MSSAAGSSSWRASWLKSRAPPATGPNPTSSSGPGARTRQPAAGCRTVEQLLQREQERDYKPGWARHVWAARQGGA